MDAELSLVCVLLTYSPVQIAWCSRVPSHPFVVRESQISVGLLMHREGQYGKLTYF